MYAYYGLIWEIPASGGAAVSGDAAWTEGQDLWAISGSVVIDGSAAWTEGQDLWAISGTVAWVGNVAWTEGQDIWAGAGSVIIDGSAAWTEIQDAWAASGTVSLPAVNGDAAWTEAQDSWAAAGDNGVTLFDTHDGAKKRKKYDEQQKRLIQEDRERNERRRQQVIEAFEQVIEGNVSRETNIQQVIEPVADYAIKTLDLNGKTPFDFSKWLSDLDNAQRMLDDYLEADDEESLLLL